MEFKIERNKWYGSVVQELNLRAAIMLSEGKITKNQHDEIVKENQRQANESKVPAVWVRAA